MVIINGGLLVYLLAHDRVAGPVVVSAEDSRKELQDARC